MHADFVASGTGAMQTMENPMKLGQLSYAETATKQEKLEQTRKVLVCFHNCSLI
jgi:hypothetical protein